MDVIKKHDFIEIEYTGKLKEEDVIFDTTDADVAKKNNLHSHSDYGPVVVCVGENQVLRGIDKGLDGKEIGKEYDVEIKPEDAFGSKDAKLIQLIPTSKFKQQKIQPMPGMQINIDNTIGIVKTVSGGRTLVDFNHPLAGKDLFYKVKINKKITDDKEKLSSYIKLSLGIKDFNLEINENNAKIGLKIEIPKEAEEKLREKITGLIPSIKKVELSFVKEEAKKS
ncbi:MAG: peptidylprolyl isomerase [Candidatus Woesearchaeota archaeon]|jgi:FKBP-type peptidyl-prolyl cis-trans isomerase SlyD|nr:peptidylprolyl isomerase [archaeon]MDP6547725.1 peptidylprolyl isomerase [Candidatus Woesearchaeota archaeon]MDP7263776.1 peptidylprolyl isomerase [Candidatus Woesearchaeota archaeon]MDP7622833.1 peptidylprolyl isomerase [Candidatus Woesearchaeota archaeon]HJN56908.1 peptidylprolyl isomerase [Candidatus Woesearchaeota archaeon]|tara:strand:- start:48015 stop:48686 length:672 start_codon:yes stop_codon:yes gene_type:complete